MKKSESIGFGLAVVLLIVSTAVFFYAMTAGSSAAQRQQSETITYQYIIKEYQGNIAVFEAGKQTPLQVYEVPVEILPETDVKSLQEGIQVRDQAQLDRLIEDLTS